MSGIFSRLSYQILIFISNHFKVIKFYIVFIVFEKPFLLKLPFYNSIYCISWSLVENIIFTLSDHLFSWKKSFYFFQASSFDISEEFIRHKKAKCKKVGFFREQNTVKMMKSQVVKTLLMPEELIQLKNIVIISKLSNKLFLNASGMPSFNQ